MMYRCFICRTPHHSGGLLIRHLTLSHGLYPGKKFKLLCAQDGCSLEFKSYCGFRRHLKVFHSDTSDTEPQSCSDSTAVTSLGTAALPTDGPNDSTSPVVNLHQDFANPTDCSSSKEIGASIIAKLQVSGVSNNTILSVVESMEEC